METTILNFPEFPDSGLVANTSYVVTSNHNITSSNSTIPANVTLYFRGGMLNAGTTGIELTGNKTRIDAPIEQLFGTSLNVGGSWRIDRAYPQWFGAQTYKDSFDNSDAINKAIIMKQTGEVFIPRGRYTIRKTIFVKMGITLCGEAGYDQGAPPSEVIYRGNNGTVIFPAVRSEILYDSTGKQRTDVQWEETEFAGGYMMMVNVEHNGHSLPKDSNNNDVINWEVSNIHPGTIVKNLYFSNALHTINKLKGIYSAGGIEVNFCTWHVFQQALKTDSKYTDMKRVENCSVTNPGGMHGSEKLYMFDLKGLGDALFFAHNAVHNGTYCHSLALSQCNGGTISTNILNADVYIGGSKGITFNSNHLEGGAQLEITSSNVTSFGNFFEKWNNRPNVLLHNPGFYDTPVVSMTNELFIYNDYASRVEGICEYDIQTDGQITLALSNVYRYWVTPGIIGKMYTFGVQICDLNNNKVDSFNNASHMLSHTSSILPNFTITNTNSIQDLGTPTLRNAANNSASTWLGENGTFYYKYQLIWDLERRIVGNQVSLGSISYTNRGQGGFFEYRGESNGYRALIRLYRGKSSSNYTHYVDVPVSGSRYLYENGFSICGYQWKTISSSSFPGNTSIESICYSGGNIQCRGTSCPGYGTWKRGDIVYNVAHSSSAISQNIGMWVYTGEPGLYSSSGWEAR